MFPFPGELASFEVTKDNLVLGMNSWAGRMAEPCCSLVSLCGGETVHSNIF